MSDEPRITKVEKEKNPMRVASGKRLAAISKMAKERKAQERQSASEEQNASEESSKDTYGGGYSVVTVITGVGVLAGLVCLYFTYRQDKRAQDAVVPNTNIQKTDSVPVRGGVPTGGRLLTLDP